ncbi:unnamed protein product (macronuclear) [Paramecium tetraurelia]|uniref:Uncharacterized protein n=1 Tax=Paramecium tetraurelia TaxID=5888 RepID=A0DMI8_PARTE|nr:uncharacterized protein GSPATT00018473001 [Paramecium tetraurelia]CAK84255.1 unnamed protein product [Paramecium tetraurelia]|eukprot:XP_001451652.1 hypothetical protein (macronuclear) [Paramecium tetraurelia strain d4-2]
MMPILQRKRDYFYQIKQLILNMLDNITQSFESLCRVADDQQSLKPIDNAIRFMDQYYDCIQFVKQDYVTKEIHFKEKQNVQYRKHSSDINHIYASQDQILSCGQEVYLHQQNKCCVIKNSTLPVYTGLILPDGKVLIGGEEKVVKVYQQFNNQYIEVTQLKGFSKAISTIVMSQNQHYIGVSSFDGRIALFHTQTLSKLGTWTNDLGSVYSISFSVDNQYVAAGSKNGIAIWEIKIDNDTSSAELTQSLNTKKKVRSIAFSCKQKFLAATQKNDILLYHYYIDDFMIYQTLHHHNGIVNCVSFGQDILISGSDDSTLCLWSSSIKGYWMCYQVIYVNCCINSIALNPQQTDLYCDCFDSIIHYNQI